MHCGPGFGPGGSYPNAQIRRFDPSPHLDVVEQRNRDERNGEAWADGITGVGRVNGLGGWVVGPFEHRQKLR